MTYQNLISKGGNAFRIIMLILTLSIINLADSAGLEMRMYNVGQANFIALKHGTNALIVDCGTALKQFVDLNAVEKSDTYWIHTKSDLVSFLDGAKISVIITHRDSDHLNRFEALSNLISLDKVIIGGNVKSLKKTKAGEAVFKTISEKFSQKTYFCKYRKDGGVKILYNLKENDETDTMLIGSSTTTFGGNATIDTQNNKTPLQKLNIEMGNLLGGEVKTEFLLPSIEKINEQISKGQISEKKSGDKSIYYKHFQNLVLKISYAGREILLPGDADENLVRCLPEEHLKNVNILLFPHHGSDNSGRDELYQYLKNSCCLGIISSNPAGTDKLPRLASQGELYKCTQIQKGKCYVREHELTFGENKKSKKQHEKSNKTDPIFLTSNATLYYKLCISSNGFMRMYDSANVQDPVFMSDKTHDLGTWNDKIAKTVSAKCDLLDKMREKLKDHENNKKTVSTIINKIESGLIKNPKSNWGKMLTNGLEKKDLTVFLERVRKGLYQLSNTASRVYTTLLDSETPMQKSEFVSTIGNELTDYEWSKARDILRDEGLMNYNSSTKKWSISLSA